MRSQVQEVNEVAIQLDKIISVCCVLKESYLENPNSDFDCLKRKYMDCVNTVDLICDMLILQRNVLDDIDNECANCKI